MSSNQTDPAKPHGLIVAPSAGLMKLPDGGSSALSEIINRSLHHIQTRADLAVPARKAGEECEFEIAPGVKIVMCWIPPGEFMMGSPANEKHRHNNETQHLVVITHGYFLAKTQITQAQWRAVMNNNPSHFAKNGNERPAEGMSWLDVCGDEAENEGFLGRINRLNTTGGHCYLPTEAQWEYACRAGTTGPYYWNLDEVAWYRDNSAGATHPVGQKQPNRWGLHDMLGNVWEWCADWYEEYSTGIVEYSANPHLEPYRVYRGGGWNNSSFNCRAATRNNYIPTNNNYVGFRIARSPVP